jgi:transcriptional regulator with XRE-family HTH domain
VLAVTLGERVKLRRKELGMSQEELALKAGYASRTSVNKIELGKQNPPVSVIPALAAALHTTPAQLMGWD